jgi:AraC-like DNA-binding protein
MPGVEAFCQKLGQRFRVENAPGFVSRIRQNVKIGVTEICSEALTFEVNDALPWEDAYLVGLQLRDFPEHEFWEDGVQAPVTDLHAGETLLYDLKRNPRFLMNKPFHFMHFYLSRDVLTALADDMNAQPIGELKYKPGIGMSDPTIKNLGASLLPALAQNKGCSRLFLDHVTLALAVHVAQNYGGLCPWRRPILGGLTPGQQRRALEILNANLHGNIALKDIARECGSSVSHFSRSFHRSFGRAPHQWLLCRRVEVAKSLLRERTLPLAQVALECGFADQSHFTRVFSRVVGASPGAWRHVQDV